MCAEPLGRKTKGLLKFGTFPFLRISGSGPVGQVLLVLLLDRYAVGLELTCSEQPIH
ncbi:hypothetical protein D3C80_1776890 [compost metagenome]